MTLYCDPSARGFGYFYHDNVSSYKAGCVDFLEHIPKEYSSAKTSRELTFDLLDLLYQLYDEIPFHSIVTEVPTGSQSSNVAWYLSAIQSTLISFCICKDIDYIPISQSQAKKKMHGRATNVKKNDTVKFVLDFYPQFSYLIDSQTTAVERQAISDAIAIYHAHQT